MRRRDALRWMTLAAVAGLGGLSAQAGIVRANPVAAATHGLPLIRVNAPGPDLAPFFPLRLVKSQAFDRQAGFVLQVRPYRSGVAAIDDLLLGNADFAGAGFPILPVYRAGGHDVTAVARLTEGAPPFHLMVRHDLRDRLQAVRDLAGASIGIHGGSAQRPTYLQAIAADWLAARGLSERRYRFVPLAMSFDAFRAALVDRRVDLLFCEEPFCTWMQREGLAVEARFQDTADDATTTDDARRFSAPDHLRAVLVALRNGVEAAPERVGMMRAALDAALDWLRRHSVDDWLVEFGLEQTPRAALYREVFTTGAQRYPETTAFDAAELAATRRLFEQLNLQWSDRLVTGDVVRQEAS